MTRGVFSLSFRTEIGQSYTVEYKNSLGEPAWIDLGFVLGTGEYLTVTDQPSSRHPSRFYRVLRTP